MISNGGFYAVTMIEIGLLWIISSGREALLVQTETGVI